MKNIYIVEQLNKDNVNWVEREEKRENALGKITKLWNLKSSFRSIHEVKNGKTFHKWTVLEGEDERGVSEQQKIEAEERCTLVAIASDVNYFLPWDVAAAAACSFVVLHLEIFLCTSNWEQSVSSFILSTCMYIYIFMLLRWMKEWDKLCEAQRESCEK